MNKEYGTRMGGYSDKSNSELTKDVRDLQNKVETLVGIVHGLIEVSNISEKHKEELDSKIRDLYNF